LSNEGDKLFINTRPLINSDNIMWVNIGMDVGSLDIEKD
jgi:hypothetical protein